MALNNAISVTHLTGDRTVEGKTAHRSWDTNAQKTSAQGGRLAVETAQFREIKNATLEETKALGERKGVARTVR